MAICPVPLAAFGGLSNWRRTFVRWLFAFDRDGLGARLRQSLSRRLYRLHLVGQTRDFRAFQQLLFEEGLAVPLGSEFVPPRRELLDEAPEVQAQIRALIEHGVPTEAAVAATSDALAPQGGAHP